MRVNRRMTATVATAAVLGLTLAACGGGDTGGDNGGEGGGEQVEVFTWWAAGSEKAGLDALVGEFETQHPDIEFVNGAVAGGAGSAAKDLLQTRLQAQDPPDTFQAHAGAELLDYINAGQIEDVSADYDTWGLKQAFPQGLIDNLTVDGKIYSVPANIHRANVVWSNTKVVKEAGITADPKTLEEFFAALDKVKAKGIAAPLAIGKDWTQLMLFESVLITDLGPEKFTGLWNGTTDWNDPLVTKAINDFKTLLTYTNTDRDALDWTDAEKLVMDGKAAYQLMGDWEAADLDAKKFSDYGWFTFPGNGKTFQWLADSFVLPKGAKNPEGTKCWLKTVGSAEGQKAFNTKKGSIPARSDAVPADYPKYQQSAMADWKKDKIVPSCAHGAACTLGQNNDILSALSQFSGSQDVAKLQSALGTAMKPS